jgi:type IV pilus assembly protein PilB
MARKKIGEILVQSGSIDPFQLESALAHQRKWGGRLGRAIVYLGFMDEQRLLNVLGEQLGVQCISLWDRPVPRDVVALVPEKMARARKVLPIARLREHRRGPLVVALAEPGDLSILDELSFATGLDIRPVLASEDELEQAIERHYGGRHAFATRPDAIELPEDTSPLRGLRRTSGAGPGSLLQ